MNSQVKQLDFTGQKVFVVQEGLSIGVPWTYGGMDVHTCVPKHFGAQAQEDLESIYLYNEHKSNKVAFYHW